MHGWLPRARFTHRVPPASARLKDFEVLWVCFYSSTACGVGVGSGARASAGNKLLRKHDRDCLDRGNGRKRLWIISNALGVLVLERLDNNSHVIVRRRRKCNVIAATFECALRGRAGQDVPARPVKQ